MQKDMVSKLSTLNLKLYISDQKRNLLKAFDDCKSSIFNQKLKEF